MSSAHELDRYTLQALLFGEEGPEGLKSAHEFIAGAGGPVSIEHRVAALNVHRILNRAAGENDSRRGSAGSRQSIGT